MIEVTHRRSQLREKLERRSRNLEQLDEAHDEALKAVERQNSSINFSLSHELTVMSKGPQRISLGSKSKSYAALLTMDGEEVAGVYRRKANDGT